MAALPEFAVRTEVGKVGGVGSVDVDLARKLVTVVGECMDSSAVGAAVDGAGYDAVPA